LAGCLSEAKVDTAARSGTARLCCPADFPGFAGHFPGEPILPAVLQLMAVRLLAETLAGGSLEEVAVERLKFKGMVRPADPVEIRLSLREEGELLRAGFTLVRDRETVASGTLIFRLAAGG
jgi:3-hydroxyacyl-[acyl-carrier-protein] dehydratase